MLEMLPSMWSLCLCLCVLLLAGHVSAVSEGLMDSVHTLVPRIGHSSTVATVDGTHYLVVIGGLEAPGTPTTYGASSMADWTEAEPTVYTLSYNSTRGVVELTDMQTDTDIDSALDADTLLRTSACMASGGGAYLHLSDGSTGLSAHEYASGTEGTEPSDRAVSVTLSVTGDTALLTVAPSADPTYSHLPVCSMSQYTLGGVSTVLSDNIVHYLTLSDTDTTAGWEEGVSLDSEDREGVVVATTSSAGSAHILSHTSSTVDGVTTYTSTLTRVVYGEEAAETLWSNESVSSSDSVSSMALLHGVGVGHNSVTTQSASDSEEVASAQAIQGSGSGMLLLGGVDVYGNSLTPGTFLSSTPHNPTTVALSPLHNMGGVFGTSCTPLPSSLSDSLYMCTGGAVARTPSSSEGLAQFWWAREDALALSTLSDLDTSLALDTDTESMEYLLSLPLGVTESGSEVPVIGCIASYTVGPAPSVAYPCGAFKHGLYCMADMPQRQSAVILPGAVLLLGLFCCRPAILALRYI
ncbi:hypothetical protein KIPB_001086 [Kipferlia bialata]|uniref:Uncharacterized protein n=1 Tax=Kipferlia bialata TaxID=797122 RepID=A0A9K3GDX9_9EUKA|nr:hypothetical protein KIPB_001086 [Kipferlia bialata]|eukprot:g1086.t1